MIFFTLLVGKYVKVHLIIEAAFYLLKALRNTG